MKTVIISLLLTLFSLPTWAQKNVALVKLLKGQVEVLAGDKALPLKQDQWLKVGDVVRTGEKSFVKLVFLDKSHLNMGPSSQMKVEAFSGKDAGVLELIKGKIRSQVTKDYLQMENKDRSKLFIKTKNAVMGVRGTDFLIAHHNDRTSVVLFEGEVVFNRLDGRVPDLERVVSEGVRLMPGEFSVVEMKKEATVPALLNIEQLKGLEKNKDFIGKDAPAKKTSVVPEGLSLNVVRNEPAPIKDIVEKAAPVRRDEIAQRPEGFVEGNKVRPANGSFLHVESGNIIPPAPDSVFDKTSNTYVSVGDHRNVNARGDFVLPKDVTISQEGKMMTRVQDEAGKMRLEEVWPRPVFDPKDHQQLRLHDIGRTQLPARDQVAMPMPQDKGPMDIRTRVADQVPRQQEVIQNREEQMRNSLNQIQVNQEQRLKLPERTPVPERETPIRIPRDRLPTR